MFDKRATQTNHSKVESPEFPHNSTRVSRRMHRFAPQPFNMGEWSSCCCAPQPCAPTAGKWMRRSLEENGGKYFLDYEKIDRRLSGSADQKWANNVGSRVRTINACFVSGNQYMHSIHALNKSLRRVPLSVSQAFVMEFFSQGILFRVFRPHVLCCIYAWQTAKGELTGD